MSEKPILFSAPMIRALLAGRKTMTRRVLKLRHPLNNVCPSGDDWIEGRYLGHGEETWDALRVPYAVGDRLWVREACHNAVSGQTWQRRWLRSADDSPCITCSSREAPGRRASMHMPRVDSRLTLTVESVKVERLQDISEADAIAEAAPLYGFISRRQAFEHLWNELHGWGPPSAWQQNPWVVALTFRVHNCNIDALDEAASLAPRGC